MCGICGYISNKNVLKETLKKMNYTLRHRGPDDHGEEIYQLRTGKYVGFAQRRLSIMDLSLKGHQPMHSPDKRVSVVFNGEIYNFKALKKEVSDYSFQSECDTEIIIALYLKWGIGFLQKINGMFAMAILDREKDKVYLARDRIGIKPLYYYQDEENNIVFGSELKAIWNCELFKKELNKEEIGRFLYRGYITAPGTIYKNTYKLEPGNVLEISGSGITKNEYWDVAKKNIELRKCLVTDYGQAKEELKVHLKNAVRGRMIADVPIGAFLSGGYDSSLVCALAQEISSTPIKTFSIGFEEEKYNEAPFAKRIAQELGTEYTEIYVTEREMLDMVDDISEYYDEPFADSSQIPTMCVSKLAKKAVSVVLSGDGGDELFGGYSIYSVMQEAQRKEVIGRILYGLGRIPQFRKTKFWRQRPLAYKVLSDDYNVEARTQIGANSYFDMINSMLINKTNTFYCEVESRYEEKRYDVTRMLLDMDTYLPDDILVKVDRATMKYALECRCPFLDKNVMEYAMRLPAEFKCASDNPKKILKDIAYEYIPKELLDRPKKGFSIPLDKWLRGILKERICEWTNKAYLKKQGIFKPDETERFIQNYMNYGDQGKRTGQNFSGRVWAYFIFQQWYERYMKAECL